MEKEWKNGGVSGVEESTECRRDWTCLLHQFIAITTLTEMPSSTPLTTMLITSETNTKWQLLTPSEDKWDVRT